MGCPCSKRAKAKAFVFVAPDGTETEKRTEIEAMALQIRTARDLGINDSTTVGEVKAVV